MDSYSCEYARYKLDKALQVWGIEGLSKGKGYEGVLIIGDHKRHPGYA